MQPVARKDQVAARLCQVGMVCRAGNRCEEADHLGRSLAGQLVHRAACLRERPRALGMAAWCRAGVG
jgi:hypothetical protein